MATWPHGTYYNCTTTSSTTSQDWVFFNQMHGTAATSTQYSTQYTTGAWTTFWSAGTGERDIRYQQRTRELTPEQKQQRLQAMWDRWVRQAVQYWKDIERKRLTEQGKQRALRLLLEHLNEDQRKMYEEKKRFHVHTADGERTYEISHGSHGNIKLIREEGKRLASPKRYCSYVRGHYPTEDAILAQKMMIEAEEDRFLEVANRF